MATLPDSLAALTILSTARLNAAGYLAPLLDSQNEIVRIGAWCTLLERDEVTYAQYPKVVTMAGYAGIRRRAFRHFMRFWEYKWAAEVADVATDSEESAEQAQMQNEVSGDLRGQIAALKHLFLASGESSHLFAMLGLQEQLGGWRSALPLAVDLMILNPHEPRAAIELLQLAYQSRQAELVDATVGVLEANNLHPAPALLYSAASKLLKGNPGGCLKSLQQLSAMRISRPDIAARIRVTMLQLSGEALEKLGDYRQAYTAYSEMNALDQGGPKISLDDYGRATLEAAALDVPPLPPDARDAYFVMTGFPRSGTTLLENALAAHPRVETFEEIPARSSMQIYLDRTLPELPKEADRTPIYLNARDRYYEEMERQQGKAGASVFIDKMPMRSAEAGFMVKVFPQKRYIFSIRHPFDVVLSCFKQHFKPNVAMEHFRTFENAVKLYDFTMNQWFAAFAMDDPRVHYLRYDTLVTEFEASMRGALGFLGLPWDDAVLGFAKAADTRGARTPSYQKVRQGLTIGVQTQWHNYKFLFQSDAAKPLYRWAEFFGYETT